MNRFIVTIALVATTACAPRYEASDEVTIVPAPARANVQAQQEITVRAFYAPDISLAELGDAICTVSAGGASVQVQTPAKISVSMRSDKLQDITAKCRAQIGPRIAESTATIPAREIDFENLGRQLQYPSKLDVRF